MEALSSNKRKLSTTTNNSSTILVTPKKFKENDQHYKLDNDSNLLIENEFIYNFKDNNLNQDEIELLSDLTMNERKEFRETFDVFDIDQDGIISKDNLTQILTLIQEDSDCTKINALIRETESNRLTFERFSLILIQIKIENIEETLRNSFDISFTNNNNIKNIDNTSDSSHQGFISILELKTILFPYRFNEGDIIQIKKQCILENKLNYIKFELVNNDDSNKVDDIDHLDDRDLIKIEPLILQKVMKKAIHNSTRSVSSSIKEKDEYIKSLESKNQKLSNELYQKDKELNDTIINNSSSTINSTSTNKNNPSTINTIQLFSESQKELLEEIHKLKSQLDQPTISFLWNRLKKFLGR